MTVKSAHVAAVELTALLEVRGSGSSDRAAVLAETRSALEVRVRGEYAEMPGLSLTVLQAARLFGIAPDVVHAVLEKLRRASVLTCSDRGTYSLNR